MSTTRGVLATFGIPKRAPARKRLVVIARSPDVEVRRAIRDRLFVLDFSLRCATLRAIEECVPSEPCVAQPECARLMRALMTLADNIDALRKEIEI